MTRLIVRRAVGSGLFVLGISAACSSTRPADDPRAATPLPPEPAADRDAGTNVPAPPSETAPPDLPHGVHGAPMHDERGAAAPGRGRSPRVAQGLPDAGAGIGGRDAGRDAGAVGRDASGGRDAGVGRDAGPR